MEQVERRVAVQAEIRRESRATGGAVIAGYAAVFNVLSDDLGGFREVIAPGAFRDTIAVADIRALVNHDPNLILGRTASGTLRLVEDDKGLAFEVDLPDTQVARDLTASVERRDISQMSFSFERLDDEWERGTPDIRTLKKVTLFDVALVTFPAYPQTEVALRSHQAWLSTEFAPPVGAAGFTGHRRRLLDLKGRGG